jgi:hypothetical protein
MKNEIKTIIYILISLCIGVLCAADISSAEQNLFPEGNIFKGWEIVKDTTFTGDALYGHIDGGAELFFEFGFVKVDVRIAKPAGSEDEMTIEIYQMADADAAFGLFLIKSANLEPDQRLPVPNLVNNYQVSYIKGDYYILISSAAGTEPLKEKMVQLGEAIAVNLPDKVHSGFESLPPAGRVPGSERLLRGPLALQTIFPLGGHPMLWQGLEKGQKLNAYAADYKTSEGDMFSDIICQYPDPNASGIAMEGIKTGHDPYLETVTDEENRFILKDWNGLYTIVIRDKSKIEIYARLKEPKIPQSTN